MVKLLHKKVEFLLLTVDPALKDVVEAMSMESHQPWNIKAHHRTHAPKSPA
jgi:hypothetical protein